VVRLDLRKGNEELAELLLTEIEKLRPSASETPATPTMLCDMEFQIVRNVEDPRIFTAMAKRAEQERARLGQNTRVSVSYTETCSTQMQIWVAPGPVYYLTCAGDAFDPADSATWEAQCPWQWKDAGGYFAARMVQQIRWFHDSAYASEAGSASP
jgi:hypothetical protein